MKKKYFVLIALIAFTMSGFSQIDKIVGKWKTIDDEDGSAKSIVYIYKATNGKYYGRIEKLFKDPEAKCTKCEGANHNKPILGMIIINSMELKGNELTNGTILDPNNGKVYYCTISYDATSKNLKVRGSLDKKGWIGRSQTWIKE
ncbi:MAG: DUF2147 domain-containing protein [Bacteroidales bacterium]|jgi:uncharacterized protein (DUF2147 family)|nr:DUF2147 domain-containing protein [Bacteroidales bacterium]MDD3331113.1 DUF2147 domain-containing protein [Bacteroidales bacterium]MDD3691935.1 DUF2147 domain-containing protein [Bacteroidales bacterium]MDD4045215.1 DUF2147 domain-containing protein [Bacteroidales bacterium]MDD4582336.1 DUF2147 domain-containing protein [Bacteroidales bacterium]